LADDRVTIQQVKEANDIVDVVGSYVSLRPAGPTYKGLCPFHEDHRPSLDVDPRRQRYRCWSCGKNGDVLQFVQDHERVDFLEALELLARRAGITLEKKGAGQQNRSRALMLEMVSWAAEQFHRCLLDSPLAEAARRYLGERRLSGEIVRRFGLGFAPLSGDWLVQRAAAAGKSTELLDKVGLIARRTENNGYYDRFRDRIMFPIRDARGNAVGFGGRILPTSPLSARAPKYYNSSDTDLFKKSDQLYGLDQARQAGTAAGYLAVVEGYTDVLMAQQMGVGQVVATMGTALNAKHVQHLRRFVPRVVLVFDADAGGDTAVDRALTVFVSQNVDLKIAALPQGLDPCDLLVQQGAEPFRQALAGAVDVLDFKLDRVWAAEAGQGVEGKRRAVEAVLGIIALAPDMPGQDGAIKQELIVNRIAQRLALKEETVWARLRELRARRPRNESPASAGGSGSGGSGVNGASSPAGEQRKAPAPGREVELLRVLLAEPSLVAAARNEIAPEHLEHPGLRRLLSELYALAAQRGLPDLDQLRVRLIDNPPLAEYALTLHDLGREIPERPEKLKQLFLEFRKYRLEPVKQELQNQLHAATDHKEAVELLRQLQNQ
jgi:DNA primase